MTDHQPALPATRWKTTCLVSFGVFIVLALAARLGGVLPGEPQLYHWLLGWASPSVVRVFRWVNEFPSRWVIGPGTLLLLWAILPARRRWWLWIGVIVLAPLFEDLAKLAVGRPRPEGTGLGFPSGHVTAAAAFFPMAAYLVGKAIMNRRARIGLWLVAAALVLSVGIARILLRAHWPADVVGGAGLGFACMAFAAWWNERNGVIPTRS